MKFKFDSKHKFYIGVIVLLVVLVLVYPYISDVGQFVKGSEKVTAVKPGPGINPPKTCTDSDGGTNYFVKGTTVDKDGAIQTDYCAPEALYERFCYDIESGYIGYMGTEAMVCPNGCSDGACTQTQELPDLVFHEFTIVPYSDYNYVEANIALMNDGWGDAYNVEFMLMDETYNRILYKAAYPLFHFDSYQPIKYNLYLPEVGVHTIVAYVDYDELINETDETNNKINATFVYP